ncbi:MAG: hypothetical protein PHR35_11965 [Kiritimatiellae bacterium]|nr:hypothetical protein [Kiritimatiellia bacterium]
MQCGREPFPFDDLSRLIPGCVGAHDNDVREQTWDVHGVGVQVVADNPRVASCAERLLGVFPPLSPGSRLNVRMALTAHRQWDIPGDAIPFPPSSHKLIDPETAYGVKPRFWRREHLNYYSFAPMGCAAYDLGKGLCVVGLSDPDAYRPWLIEHLVLQMLLLEMLRGQGLFWLHAGCVSHDGRAVLFTGHTGSGKTTACLNLAVNGFDFLAEDRIFVRSDGSGVTLLGYPRDMAVTPETLALLPALRERVGAVTFTARKLRLPAAALFHGNRPTSAIPGLILFPRITEAARTTFQSLPPTQTLCRLLPNSLLASQPDVSTRHFSALSSLARSSRAYELLLGRDVAALPGLVRDLMADGTVP